jgi:hypothetical protein
MKALLIVAVAILFFIGSYFLILEGIKEGTTKQKMYRQAFPNSYGGKRYHRSYSIIYGIILFIAASYFLYLLFF